MPKYYVRSGQLEQIVTADDPEEAAYKAVCKSEDEELDKAFYIDERGLRGPTPQEQSFDTEFLPDHMFTTSDLLQKWEGY